MDKLIKTIWFWAALIGVVLLTIWYRQRKPDPPTLIPLDYKPTEEYTDKDGVKHQTILTVEVPKEVMKQIIDSLARNLKNVQTITQIVRVTDTVFRDVPVVTDTATGDFHITKEDQYLRLKVQGNFKSNTSDIDLEMRDSLTVAITREKRFLRSDVLRTDVSSTSPYTKALAGRSFTLQDKKTYLSLGLTAGYGYNLKQGFAPFIGVGVTFPIINIR